MHQRNAVAREMRMRVQRDRRAMRGPARMRDPGRAFQVSFFDLSDQVLHAAHRARALKTAVIHGHAARIVAVVLQPFQALEQNGHYVARRDRADDTAHLLVTLSSRRWRRLPLFDGPLPARPHDLLFLGQREFAWRHVLGNGRAGTYGCARMDGDRRNQLDIGTDQYVVLDHGAVLVHAVVVARDGAGADIHVASYAGVAHVGEMVGLRALTDVGRLDFDEIADVHL